MKKQLLKAVSLLLSISLLCSCGTPESESTLSSVPETAGQAESYVDETVSSQETSIAVTESTSETTKQPETEENSMAETTTEKTETTITTTKAIETESTPKLETTISTTTTKKPETVTTPKPETTTTTTSKKPDTTATPKPETTTATITTKAPETTTIATEKPDDTPTGHCEGFDKLWGKNLEEVEVIMDKWVNGNIPDNTELQKNFYESSGNYPHILEYHLSNSSASEYNFWKYNRINISDISISFAPNDNNRIIGVEMSTAWSLYDDAIVDKYSTSIDNTMLILSNLYDKPDETIIENKRVIYKWNNTKDGNIKIDNYVGISPVSGLFIYISDSNYNYIQ